MFACANVRRNLRSLKTSKAFVIKYRQVINVFYQVNTHVSTLMWIFFYFTLLHHLSIGCNRSKNLKRLTFKMTLSSSFLPYSKLFFLLDPISLNFFSSLSFFYPFPSCRHFESQFLDFLYSVSKDQVF